MLNLFNIEQLIEKKIQKNYDGRITSIDFKMVYDNVLRKKL